MLRIIYLVFFVFICNLCSGYALTKVKPVPKPAILKTDSSVISIRPFNGNALNAYSKQPEFKYNDTIEPSSWWDRFWRWFWDLFAFPKSNFHGRTFLYIFLKILEYLAIIACVGAIIFFILKLAGIDMLSLFRNKSQKAGLDYAESVENIHDIDFDAEIENAVNQHNYRLAVRLLYLMSLKQLSDRGLIVWQPEKTNNTYIDELQTNSQHDTFKTLTNQFEYVWYGEFPIDQHVYDNINFMFQKFKRDMA